LFVQPLLVGNFQVLPEPVQVALEEILLVGWNKSIMAFTFGHEDWRSDYEGQKGDRCNQDSHFQGKHSKNTNSKKTPNPTQISES